MCLVWLWRNRAARLLLPPWDPILHLREFLCHKSSDFVVESGLRQNLVTLLLAMLVETDKNFVVLPVY